LLLDVIKLVYPKKGNPAVGNLVVNISGMIPFKPALEYKALQRMYEFFEGEHVKVFALQVPNIDQPYV